METGEEFFDAFETIEQINISLALGTDESIVGFNSDPIRTSDLPSRIEDFSEYKTDVCLPAKKSTLFSWTTQNLAKKNCKDVKEFSGLEIIQEIPLLEDLQRNWVLKFSPDNNYLIVAGESPTILIFSVYCKNNTEKSSNLLGSLEKYTGHNQSIISVSWNLSSESFISCGVDCLVLLWNIGQTVPIKQFILTNIVTCLGFSPIHNSIFYTGSLDKKICLWSVDEETIENTYQAQGLVTAGSYSPNGLLLAVGMSNGQCVFYEVYNCVLTFLTQIYCKNRKGIKSSGKKVTGIEFQDDQYVLICTNDSNIRLFNLADFSVLQKYKGGVCEQFPIKSSFSHNFVHVIRGSEDGKVYVWNTFKSEKKKKWSFGRSGIKNNSYEYFSLTKQKTNSNAIFAPYEILHDVQNSYLNSGSEIIISHIIISCIAGKLFVLYNQFKNVPW